MSRINNEFRLSGRMGGPLEKTFNPNNGNPIGRISLAVDNSYTDRDSGEVVDRTLWHDLTFYNAKHVERLEKFGGKGREIHVQGTIGKDIWDSKTRKHEDGVTPAKDSRVTLLVSGLLLGREPSSQGQQGSESSPGASSGGGYDNVDDDIPL